LKKDEADTFDGWADSYFAFKADPKSGDEMLADSTLELRYSIYRRILEPKLTKMKLTEIRHPMHNQSLMVFVTRYFNWTFLKI
jgi:hypothetical protein